MASKSSFPDLDDRLAPHQPSIHNENSVCDDIAPGSDSNDFDEKAEKYDISAGPAKNVFPSHSHSLEGNKKSSTRIRAIRPLTLSVISPRPQAASSSTQLSPPGAELAGDRPTVARDLLVKIPSSAADESCTKPIAIPPRPRDRDLPATPLTGREPPDSYFPVLEQVSSINKHIASSRPDTILDTNSPFPGQQANVDCNMNPRSNHQTSLRPSSPLAHAPASPIAIPASPSLQRHRQRHSGQSLNLPGLPKYHPANFPSSDTATPISPRGLRGLNSSQRASRGSDATQKLHQYQRDMMANAKRQSAVIGVKPGLCAKPTSPRLLPLGSPAGTMTPLALEGQGDYLLAGSRRTRSNAHDTEARDWVARLVDKENERRVHTDAGSAALSPSISPAVSPAGGRV